MQPAESPVSPAQRRRSLAKTPSSTGMVARKSVINAGEAELRALKGASSTRRPHSAPTGPTRRRQRPATASGMASFMLLGDQELASKTKDNPRLQAIEDAEVRRQKGRLRCEGFAYRDWMVDMSEQAPADLQELREKHNHIHRARNRPQSSPPIGTGGRRTSVVEVSREKNWESLAPAQKLRSLSAVLEGRRQGAGPDGFSRLLESVAKETTSRSAMTRSMDSKEREKAESDRLMTRLVQVLLLSASTLRAAFDKLDVRARGKLCKKDFQAGLRAMGLNDASKEMKTVAKNLGFDDHGSTVQLSFSDFEGRLSPYLASVITDQQNAYRAQHGVAILPTVDATVDQDQLRVLQQFKQMLHNTDVGEAWAARRARCRRAASIDLLVADPAGNMPGTEKKLFQGSNMKDTQRDSDNERTLRPMATCEGPIGGRVEVAR